MQREYGDDSEEERLRGRLYTPEPVEPAPEQTAPVAPAPFEQPYYPPENDYQPPPVYNDPGPVYQPQQQYETPTEPIRSPDPTPPAGSNVFQTGGNATLNDIVANLYRNVLGREASLPEIGQWISGTGGNLAQIQQGIYGSAEAAAYQQRQQQQQQAPTGGAAAGGSVVDRIRAYQQSHPASEGIAGISAALGLPRFMYGNTPSNNELVVNGQKFKVIGAEDSPSTAYWYTGGSDSGGGGGGAAAPAGGGNPFGVGQQPRAPSITMPTFGSNSLSQYGSTPAGQPQGIWGADYLAQLRTLLMQRLQEAGKPVDENAAGITEALTGARNEATRLSDKERTDLAERLYAQGGLNTDAISQQVQQSGERNATALGSLRGKLIMQEYQAKREDLRSLLALALQSGDAESARAIQAQMAELEATLRREGYGVQLAAITANQNQAAGSLGI